MLVVGGSSLGDVPASPVLGNPLSPYEGAGMCTERRLPPGTPRAGAPRDFLRIRGP